MSDFLSSIAEDTAGLLLLAAIGVFLVMGAVRRYTSGDDSSPDWWISFGDDSSGDGGCDGGDGGD